MTVCISLNKISKSFQFGKEHLQVLKDLDLTINEGDFLAVVGPSGSGKTTLLNLISLIDKPDKGDVNFGGTNTLSLNDNQLSIFRNNHIGIIFQHFNLIPVLSALENVCLPLLLNGINKKQAESIAKEMLTEVGLANHIYQKPNDLSGGQRQRVAIARALATRPKLVIADEPTASLDKESGINIINLMKDMNKRYGTTFVFSTHDPRMLERIEYQITINQGKIEKVS